LRSRAGDCPDRTAAVVDGISQMTYAEWDARSNGVARTLVAEGVGPGQRVALLFTNADGLDYLVAYMAVHKAGGVAVPLNPKLTPTEVSTLLAHADPVALLHGDATRELVDGLAERPSQVMDGPALRREAASGDGAPFQIPREPSDLADVLYTSGTTGLPKGVACTHENILFRGSSTLTDLFAGVAFLHAVPLFTFAGTHAMTLIALRGGMTHVIAPSFDARRFLELLQEHRVALSYVVPAMALRMLEQTGFEPGSFRKLRVLMYGTASMPPHAVKQLAELFPGTFLINLYGLTEGGAAVCSLSPAEALKRPDSLGKPLPPTEVRIGEDGEISMRTGVPPRWYYKDEAGTAEVWAEDGWVRTGDIGYLDDDGYLYLVDRRKDLIIAGGHNISAAEVEGALLQHPAVLEAAVVGEPHPVMGEVPRACVVLRHPTASDDLERFMRDRLADYKVPRTYTVLTELPRNALGKVLKRDLRQATP